ncbi:SGNH/GDSL hydrolase family protein [Adhaeretor mobilis]|uniref:Uncharacterized protein n=1 Tax=Adhaeretor mobilis TaxID=1930276 RepID=A0A517MTG8_9BACT|nr:SGNH/GDSL hydrolase family protein [Adhaeretor mobilis]QDS98181.1 hypothetical protein HG15A2_14540 [Adhaeretor mobilis]
MLISRSVRFIGLITLSLVLVSGTIRTTQAQTLPRVLMIGDSIMQGYFHRSQIELAGQFVLFQPDPGSGDTDRATVYMQDWLDDGPWDVIHFNWGLHDLYTQNVNHPGVNAIPIEDYESNLRSLVPQMVASGADLVWANTTPGVDPLFPVNDVLAYNAVAAQVMSEYDIPINDLHGLLEPVQETYQATPGNIHYNTAGSALMAEQVAASILSVHDPGSEPGPGSCGALLCHSGANDPFLEGWLSTIEAGATVAPVIDDMGSGLDAWEVKNSSGTGKGYYSGAASLDATALADIATGGWSMRATLRVDDVIANGYDESLSPAPGLHVRLVEEEHWMYLFLSTDSSGNPIAQLKGGAGLANVSDEIPISGSGYHTYEMRSQPMTTLADFYIDGTKVISDFEIGNTVDYGNRIDWGSASTGADGAGYWNSVQFTTAPGSEFVPGDFDDDDDVDGADFLVWQRDLGDDPSMLSWETNYGFAAGASAGAMTVPEPSGFVLLILTGLGCLAFRKQETNDDSKT